MDDRLRRTSTEPQMPCFWIKLLLNFETQDASRSDLGAWDRYVEQVKNRAGHTELADEGCNLIQALLPNVCSASS